MEFDLVIQGGSVIDGTGRPGVPTDVGISGDRIAAVDDLDSASAAKTLDATGKVVSPGFIDIHTHSDFTLLLDPHGEGMVRQGVTTNAIGNCSLGAYPVQRADRSAMQEMLVWLSAGDLEWDWTDLEGYRRRFNAQGAALNVAPLVGHSAVRVAAMGYGQRAPTAVELAEMRRLLAKAMDHGAVGMSVGLTYAPSGYADTEELVSLAEVVARYDGFYAAHQRVDLEKQYEARLETLEIARRAGLPAQMSHNNVSGKRFWHIVPDILELLDREHGRGVDVTFDVYPYDAGMSIVDQVMPAWAQEGGATALLDRLGDDDARRRIYDELREGRGRGPEPWDWEAIRVTDVEPPGDPEWSGKTVRELAEIMNVDPVETLLRLTECRAAATFHLQSLDNTRLLMQHPLGMIGSDGNAVTVGGSSLRGKPHPRYFGTFPRFLGEFGRDEGLLPLPEAIRKITSAPAQRLGLRDRGLLEAGRVADVAVFDPVSIADRATFDDPLQYATGVDSVLVAGQFVLEQGHMTQALPGRALARGS
ncbi:MAG: N-acyl-D-amino-acid deacylase [Dehalococcoidia bacterium]|nr:N-acyl-D-amino-acid deacylase [Dehalococcoidia bacterium]